MIKKKKAGRRDAGNVGLESGQGKASSRQIQGGGEVQPTAGYYKMGEVQSWYCATRGKRRFLTIKTALFRKLLLRKLKRAKQSTDRGILGNLGIGKRRVWILEGEQRREY